MTKYYSRSKQKFVDIEQMPDQYVRNAFVKMCKTEVTEDTIFALQQKDRADDLDKKNYDLVNANKNLGDRVDGLTKDLQNGFISGVGDLDKIESLIKHNNRLQAMSDKLKDTTKSIVKEKDLAIFTLRSSLDHNLSKYKQLTDTLRDDTMYQPYDKQGRVRDYQVEYAKLAKERDKWKEKSMNMIEKSTHTELEMENVRLVAQLEHDEHNVGKLDDTVSKDTYQVMWDNCQVLQNERAKLLKENNELKDQVQTLLDRNSVLSRMYNNSLSTLGDVKMFSEIPNTVEGAKLILEMKKYLNRDSYKIRVRGQYLDEETKKTEGWRKYERGQPIEKSKCLRVYVDVKKDVD